MRIRSIGTAFSTITSTMVGHWSTERELKKTGRKVNAEFEMLVMEKKSSAAELVKL